MADYSYSEIMRMQNDAIRRVEEMQKKARLTAGLEDVKKEQHPRQTPPIQGGANRVKMPDNYLEDLKRYAANSSHIPAEKKPPEKPHSNKSEGGIAEKLKSTLGELNIDSDKAILLSLILLLSEEEADETLLLALLYMLT